VKDEQRRKEFADIYAPLRQNMRNIQENMMKTTPEQRKQECDALISQLEKDIAEDIEDAKSKKPRVGFIEKPRGETRGVFLLAGWVDGDKFQVAFVVLKGSSSCD